MNAKLRLPLPLLIVVIITGCAGITHEVRLPDGTVDKTSGHAFLMKGSLEGLNTTSGGKQGTNSYTHSLRLKSAQGETEIEKVSDMMNRIAEGLASGAVKGATGRPPIPSAP